MDDQWRQETQPLVLEGGIHMPYSWTLGRAASRFFIEIRDQRRLLASPCEACSEVWLPPRSVCPICFQPIPDGSWVEVGPEGVLQYFTVVRYEQPSLPFPPPVAYGVIRLDGATRSVTHVVSTQTPETLRPGQRVRPVFEEARQGSILDIAYFVPVEGEDS